MYYVAIDVQCHNGHNAIWYWRLNGLTWQTLGVPQGMECDCPKFSEGQGYGAVDGAEPVLLDLDEVPDDIRRL